jgi:hypothetical protein
MSKLPFIRFKNLVQFLSTALFCVLAFFSLPTLASSASPKFVFSCSAENDLFVLLKKSGLKPERYGTPEKAVSAATRDSVVLLLADGYPTNTLEVSSAIIKLADEKNVRLYVEFPSFVPGITLGSPKKLEWERFVVNGNHFGSALPN